MLIINSNILCGFELMKLNLSESNRNFSESDYNLGSGNN